MEDKVIKRKVDSEKSLSYVWFFSRFHAFYPNLEYNFLQKIHVVLVILFVNTLNITTLTIQLFFVNDLKEALNNLPTNVTITACFLKFLMFLSMRVEVIGLKDLFAKLDSKPLPRKQVGYLEKLISRCKKITIIVFILYESVISSAALNAALSNRRILLFEVYVPYEWHDPPWVYWCTFWLEYGTFLFLGIQNLTNDLIGPLCFIMLNTHLEILLERIQSIGWNPTKSSEENYNDFINCIEDHRIIIKIFDVLQNSVSFTIFLQFATTALVLCMQVLLCLLQAPTLTEFMFIMFFCVDVILQILPCCYYSNNFMLLTDRIVTAVYSSNIFDQTPKFKKTAIIFMQMTQKSRVIVAGKVIPVTLGTFASILKLSYSLFTLANRLR